MPHLNVQDHVDIDLFPIKYEQIENKEARIKRSGNKALFKMYQ
jgi:hypothetical protein